MERRFKRVALFLCVMAVVLVPAVLFAASAAKKPSPDECLSMLKAGNERFAAGKSTFPHTGQERIRRAGQEDQADHAIATVLSCSDSRVPPEYIFDAGVMDIFVIRVAGNVANVDEIGCIEYGLCHVNTPVLMVMGHSQCGAVTAVCQAADGHGHPLERNIPPLVASIQPAVKTAQEKHPAFKGDALVPFATEENIWKAIENVLLQSPAVRNLVKSGKVKVVGASYDVGTGKVRWLPQENVTAILKKVESDPKKETKPMASDH